ncbi:hypothetical protein LT011_19325 [Vibrio cholerae]|uniref:hypothetical protein n=1 Tax=Vibrio cholerae TaxID=666 RepID=UPI001E40D8D8|nr:hypothetical protein [Vibrio cholerae]MCD6704780.1 hypothetical protein [Vibrio cholerae]
MFKKKFKYSIHSNKDGHVGTISSDNPISIGDAIKSGIKSYSVTDIWHSDFNKVLYVVVIAQ